MESPEDNGGDGNETGSRPARRGPEHELTAIHRHPSIEEQALLHPSARRKVSPSGTEE
jgi:hypothetical protein